MKLPVKITSRHRIRDTAIVEAFLEGLNSDEIVETLKLKITPRMVRNIIYRHRAQIKIDKAWEGTKQYVRIKRMIKKYEKQGKISCRDIYDWERLLDDKLSNDGESGEGRHVDKLVIVRSRPAGEEVTGEEKVAPEPSRIGGIELRRPIIDSSPEVIDEHDGQSADGAPALSGRLPIQ